QAHRFNPQGANSLLKVLEEPPPGTYFILTATGVESVLPTLRSRSQCFRFPALSEEHLRKLFPDAPGWMTSGALGRLDDLHNLGEERLTATRLLAENLWTQLLAGKPQKAF